MAVNQENHGAFSVYPMGKMETAAASAVSSSWPQYTNTGTHTSTWNFCFINVEISTKISNFMDELISAYAMQLCCV